MITQEMREQRKTGIGGSDIGAILGLSKFRTAYDVFVSKTQDEEDKTNDAIEWGNRLEAVVADKYGESLIGESLEEVDTLRHPDHEWAIANIDRLVVDADGKPTRILEIKTANAFSKGNWENGVPEAYYAQVQWYMWIWNLEEADIAVLIGGSDYRVYPIPRDDKFINNAIEVAQAFWHNTQLGLPPTLSTEDAKAAYNEPVCDSIEDSNAEVMCHQIKALDEEIKSAKQRQDDIKARLMDIMGNHEELTSFGNLVATWKNHDRTTVDTKRLKAEMPEVWQQYARTSTTRTLRIK